ncbi:MAG TPA: lytic transglycosylase domain-containing protein [Chitinophagaceae bacterium]|nr:lytic transglycosylase domain-containing protein [Chitinophagaceae bacterium]
MTIIKKISTLGIFCFFLVPVSFAGRGWENYQAQEIKWVDTTGKKDSVEIIIDPKQGFKDLFVTPSIGNGIYSEELNVNAVSFVQDYIEKFGKTMEDMKSWGKPYFDMMDEILTQHGLPKELKYLAVIESHLKASVRSWAGAVGPWQFMPNTARNFGLRVGRTYDERTDYFKSTHAASRYLTQLFALYGDWLLVIAAYNGGPGNVNYAIKKSGSHDFWSLEKYLPLESRNHVKKFIATHYIMEKQGGVTTFTKEEIGQRLLVQNTNKEIPGTKMQPITGRYNSLVIAKQISFDIVLFNSMNPDFDKQIGLNGKYDLRLPDDKMDLFIAKKYTILEECMRILLQPTTNDRP